MFIYSSEQRYWRCFDYESNHLLDQQMHHQDQRKVYLMEGKKVYGKGGEISKGIFNLMLSQKNQITVLKNFSVIPRLKTGGEEAWFNFRD